VSAATSPDDGPPAGFEREQLSAEARTEDEATERLFREKLGRTDRWALLNVVQALPHFVGDDDELVGLAAPMFEGDMGLLAATERKVIFLLQRSRPDEELVIDRIVLPYPSLKAVEMASVVDLRIVTADREYVLRGKAKQLAEFAALVAERTGESAGGSSSAA
jgi:hypothetical protein